MVAGKSRHSVEVHLDREPWPAIRAAVGGAAGRVVAAIGYIGQDAHHWLPLKAGDVLVCDASERAVLNGATNPRHIADFLVAGVEVWSEEGLHAKVVVVLPRRAFVGSANASNNSANGLVEAVLETSDAAAVRALREFVMSRGHRRVDAEEVAQLIPLIPKRSRPQPVARRVAVLPATVDRVAVIGISLGEWSKNEQRFHDEHRDDARSDARHLGSGVRIDPVSVTPWVYDRLDAGDWVIEFEDRRVYSPGVVVERAAYRDSRMVWLARPRAPRTFVSAALAASAGIPVAEQMKVLVGAEADRAVRLFEGDRTKRTLAAGVDSSDEMTG
jgi:hypothetical protein